MLKTISDNDELSNSESERIQILKALFTIMILFIHSYGENINFASGNVILNAPEWFRYTKIILSNVISMCAVSGFFFLSAFLLYCKPFLWRENIIKKFRRLVIPYFIINTFWIAVVFVAQHIPLFSGFFSNSDLFIGKWGWKDWFAAYIGSPTNSFPFLYPLWFLRDLFVMNLLSKIIERIVEVFGYHSLFFFMALWLFIDSSHIFFCDIRAICFWGIGCVFAKKERSLSRIDNINSKVICALYICLIVCTGVLLNSKSLGALVIYRLCIAVGIVFWYVCATNFKSRIKTVLLFVSNYSFCIYLFHELNLTALKKVCAIIFSQTLLFQFIEYMGIPFIILLFCLILSILLEKLVPNVYFVINGGRRDLKK